MPRALAAAFGPARLASGTSAASRFVADVTWAQYCLALFLRLQDDVADGDGSGGPVLFGANQYLLEAHRVFRLHMGQRSWFWDAFHESLDASMRAWARVEELQAAPRAPAGALLRQYGRMGSALTVAAAAVCDRARRREHYRVVADFSAHMCIAGQMLDDLGDLVADLHRARFNYAAKVLLRPSAGPEAARLALDRVAAHIVRGDRLRRVYRIARTELDHAHDRAKDLSSPALGRYVTRARADVDRAQALYHRTRAALVLSPLLGASRSHLPPPAP